jgi:UDP-N-acetylglucosamine 1-carboxyvinyltransferase
MDKIIISGGRRLRGEVAISGAKNAALPMLAAALLSDGWNTFSNVPALRDIASILELLAHLGALVERDGDVVRIEASGLNNVEAPYDLVRKMRASVLVLGPMLARLKRARVSLPGGCAIGARPIDLHLRGLERLGADVHVTHGYVEALAERLKGAHIAFDTVTVTGTENLMMAAVLAQGVTVLRNAAREPEIVALAEMLNRMGARIEGAGTAVVTIEGVDQLQPTQVRVIPDRIETGTYMAAAALTAGDVHLSGTCSEHLGAVIDKMRQCGVDVETDNGTIRVQGPEKMRSVNVKTMPHPGFPTDMQAQFMVMMSVAEGTSVISETIFENRFLHAVELQRMGADITIDGNVALVKGVPYLSGAPVMASDLRASASLVLAGLVADGETVVNRVYHLDRGYAHLVEKMNHLGAEIRRESS